MDCDISESCYKETILQRNYRKMNSFVKFHGYVFFLSHNMFMLYPNLCYSKDSVPDLFFQKVNFKKTSAGDQKA